MASTRKQNRLRLRRRAAGMVAQAIKRGDLARLACQDCGHEETDAHHEDYSKPLEVRWLCRGCHRRYRIDEGSKKLWMSPNQTAPSDYPPVRMSDAAQEIGMSSGQPYNLVSLGRLKLHDGCEHWLGVTRESLDAELERRRKM